MGRVIYRIPAFVIVLAMVLPSVGPLLDHHFAERQPSHLHFGTDGYHEHVHAYETGTHIHVHDGAANDRDYPVAFYNYDAGPSAMTVVINADTAMNLFLQYRPTSVFVLPSSDSVLVKNNYIPPLGKPPRNLG